MFLSSHIKKIFLIISILILSQPVQAKQNSRYQYNDNQIKISLSPRTPEQIAAFYEGRGFKKEMVNKLKQQCFITIGIHNKSKDILWHDASKWIFTSKSGNIQRLDRTHWKSVWKEMNIPLAHQSTFHWTQLPEKLDFRSSEGEGGNIILPYTNQPITLKAEFKTKANKSGKPINVMIDGIQCVR